MRVGHVALIVIVTGRLPKAAATPIRHRFSDTPRAEWQPVSERKLRNLNEDRTPARVGRAL